MITLTVISMFTVLVIMVTIFSLISNDKKSISVISRYFWNYIIFCGLILLFDKYIYHQPGTGTTGYLYFFVWISTASGISLFIKDNLNLIRYIYISTFILFSMMYYFINSTTLFHLITF